MIDFGIARAAEAPTEHTRPDQMVGTIAYMAPERFATGAGRRPPEPAMDVFAWGVLVAFAATGRTPFAADSPVATAARILTQPPELDGLGGPIRELVAAALAKDPDQRPSAHELLSRLLAAGAADQAGPVEPQLQWAALAMRNNADAATERAEEAAEAWAWVARRRRVRQGLRNTVVFLGLTAFVLAVAGVGTAAMDWRVTRPVEDSFRTVAIADPLRGPGTWMPAAGRHQAGGTCDFSPDGLTAVRRAAADHRCAGPERSFAGPIITVRFLVAEEGDCAAVWLRISASRAHRVAACAERVTVAAENRDGVTTLGSAPVNPGFWYQWTTLTIVARGSYIDVELEGSGKLRTRIPAGGPDDGRLALGVVRDDASTSVPDGSDPLNEHGLAYFADVRVWEP
ncbi:hypothetical protein AMIS_52690 [Actinoplanes missouriensis 431]|uniref:non-specific serine/threonine protein kinase n=1 Tax=Actinoplanes missouriensis (strain ATCC 14538 / DSM 43046 / CBS 188.64 / JCM 3121 / NBRC 102363 / NCIMB 12654 / NRRL B-3342 / UNCC 431) TaxID=512565 RepID=I0HBV2_ACTM4|nr:protein kinase [Actinoplanes missouriensis]BAL90489.1 hypothetical protein AMIS_52690 [Actinoplanes missouriensis 431]